MKSNIENSAYSHTIYLTHRFELLGKISTDNSQGFRLHPEHIITSFIILSI